METLNNTFFLPIVQEGHLVPIKTYAHQQQQDSGYEWKVKRGFCRTIQATTFCKGAANVMCSATGAEYMQGKHVCPVKCLQTVGLCLTPWPFNFSRNACHDVSVKYRTGGLSQSVTRALEERQSAHVPTLWRKLSADKLVCSHANNPPLTEGMLILGDHSQISATAFAISDSLVWSQTSHQANLCALC